MVELKTPESNKSESNKLSDSHCSAYHLAEIRQKVFGTRASLRSYCIRGYVTRTVCSSGGHSLWIRMVVSIGRPAIAKYSCRPNSKVPRMRCRFSTDSMEASRYLKLPTEMEIDGIP